MNQFFYESRGKEKLRELRTEGMMSQEFYRAGERKFSLLRGLPKLILFILGILGFLQLIIR